MSNVVITQPDFKVFFRRLLVPDEMNAANSTTPLTPSQAAGLVTPVGPVTPVAAQIAATFSSYQPTQFKNAAIAKATQAAASYTDNLAQAKKNLAHTQAAITRYQNELATTRPNASGIQLKSEQVNQLLTDIQIYSTATGPDLLPYETTLANLNSMLVTLSAGSGAGLGQNSGAPSSSGAASAIAQVNAAIVTTNNLIFYENSAFSGASSTTTMFPSEQAALDTLIVQLNNLVTIFGISAGGQAAIIDIEKKLAAASAQLQDDKSNLAIANASSAFPPIYDPILLDCVIGVQQVHTSINRLGNLGTASVTFHLPLAGNGQVPNLFMGMQVGDVFSLNTIEAQASAASGAAHGLPIPATTMSILTPNLRETTIQPFDMIQIWEKKRYAVTAVFPGDYAPIFTGFVSKPEVSYSGSAISVKISAVDTSKFIRMANVDIDPSLDPNINSLNFSQSVFTNNLAGSNMTGAQMIRSVIGGQPGSFLGMSKTSFISTVVQTPGPSGTLLAVTNSAQTSPTGTALASNVPGAHTQALSDAALSAAGQSNLNSITSLNASDAASQRLATNIVSLAWDLGGIRVCTFDDMVNGWPPYERQLKSVFRKWQVDEKKKWDVCQEIAGVQEFELYVDSLGVVNYHPPLYYLNPFGPQYYIEDVDVITDTHSKNESEIVTVMELDTQADYVASATLDPIQQGRFIAQASTPVIQRYGLRYDKKSSPIFSATSAPPQVRTGAGNKADTDAFNSRNTGGIGYARALMNRRNARIQSATVTIPGTAEMRLCNTVAFVGNLASTVKYAAAAAPHGGNSVSATLMAALQQVLVYYISVINHDWIAGKDATTSLVLTHGRHWTDPLPIGGVGFGVGASQTDLAFDQMSKYYGQGNPAVNAKNFLNIAQNKVLFTVNPNPNLVAATTNSQFAFAYQPVTSTPPAFNQFKTTLSSSVSESISRLRSQVCNPQFSENDLAQKSKQVKSQGQGTIKALGNILDNAINAAEKEGKAALDFLENVGRKGLKFLAAYVQKVERTVIADAEQLANEAVYAAQNIDAAAFKAYLGTSAFKVIASEAFASGSEFSNLGSSYTAPLNALGFNISEIASIEGSIIICVYAASSKTSFDDAMNQALMKVSAQLNAPKGSSSTKTPATSSTTATISGSAPVINATVAQASSTTPAPAPTKTPSTSPTKGVPKKYANIAIKQAREQVVTKPKVPSLPSPASIPSLSAIGAPPVPVVPPPAYVYYVLGIAIVYKFPLCA